MSGDDAAHFECHGFPPYQFIGLGCVALTGTTGLTFDHPVNLSSAWSFKMSADSISSGKDGGDIDPRPYQVPMRSTAASIGRQGKSRNDLPRLIVRTGGRPCGT